MTKQNELTQFLSGPMAVHNGFIYFVLPQYRLFEFYEHEFFRQKKDEITTIQKSLDDHDVPIILKVKIPYP